MGMAKYGAVASEARRLRRKHVGCVGAYDSSTGQRVDGEIGSGDGRALSGRYRGVTSLFGKLWMYEGDRCRFSACFCSGTDRCQRHTLCPSRASGRIVGLPLVLLRQRPVHLLREKVLYPSTAASLYVIGHACIASACLYLHGRT